MNVSASVICFCLITYQNAVEGHDVSHDRNLKTFRKES
jgi:hypothetical protein